MIGTRHEKALIVLTSYVIGFTTAFIAFGITNMGNKGEENKDYASSKGQYENIDYTQEHKNIAAIGSDDEGLFVTVGGYNRIISGKMPALEASAIASLRGPGYAFEHHGAVVSKNGWLAFYCEQEKEDSVDCLPYVYSLYDDSVHPVTLDGQQVYLDSTKLTSDWSTDNYLIIDGYYSDSIETPWKFYTPIEDVAETEETPETETTEVAPEVTEEVAKTPETAPTLEVQ